MSRNENSAASTPPPSTRLAGGLPAVPRGHMPTLFSLIIWWWLLSMVAFVFVPFVMHRFTDSPWTDPRRIFFWSVLCVVSTAHGALAYLMSFRRGVTPLMFVVGAAPGLLTAWIWHLTGHEPGWPVALAFPIGLVGAMLATMNRPEREPAQPGMMVRALDRMAFMSGNLWFGISQLAAIMVTVSIATVYETSVGPNLGNEAAYARFYNANWFGALCVLFFCTLYSATMRKYPFRISQIGWLCTHAGLLLLIIGCLVMFYGSYEGRMTLYEGETSKVVHSSRERELVAYIPGVDEPVNLLLSCDRDPTFHDVNQTIPVRVMSNGNAEDYKFTIDKYLSNGEFYMRLVDVSGRRANADPETAHAGFEIEISAMGQKDDRVLIVDHPDLRAHDFGMMSVGVIRAANEETVRGLSNRYAPDNLDRGKLEVLSADGKVAGSIPIRPGERTQETWRGAPIDGEGKQFADLGVTVRPIRFYSYFAENERAGMFDAKPDRAVAPALVVEVNGQKGIEHYVVLSDGSQRSMRSSGTGTYGMRFRYRVVPELNEPSSIVFVVGPGDSKQVAVVDREGRTKMEKFEIGKSYSFNDKAPVKVIAKRFVADADVETGFEQTDHQNGWRAIHVIASHRSNVAETWLLAGQPAREVQLGATKIELAYLPRPMKTDFSISVLDFREINYPNSTKPKAFETNLVLRDQDGNVRDAVLVDMNHPLDYRGLRFFNGSPAVNPQRGKRGVSFQVTRNPGYSTILVGTIIVSIGIALVFFFKPRLKQWEQRRRDAKAAAGGTVPSTVAPRLESPIPTGGTAS